MLRLVPPRLPARVGRRRVEAAGVHALHARYPPTAVRRRSRARVRMMSSSFCTVAAVDRRVDPGAALVDLARGRHAQRIGAQVLVEDRDRQLDPLAGRIGVGVPVGDDHSAVGIRPGAAARTTRCRSPPATNRLLTPMVVIRDGASWVGTSRLRAQPGAASARIRRRRRRVAGGACVLPRISGGVIGAL